jgi:hypothetical protein
MIKKDLLPPWTSPQEENSRRYSLSGSVELSSGNRADVEENRVFLDPCSDWSPTQQAMVGKTCHSPE